MTRLSLFATVVLATGAHAGQYEFAQAVCVLNRGLVNNFVMAQAQAGVAEIFARAGVRIEWISSKLCPTAAANVLRLEMDPLVPANFGPETVAYAMPYAIGTSIHIFYHRVTQSHRDQASQVLSHVIAHEIGHVLQGVARQSSGGLMKPYWDLSDFSKMDKYNLPFAAHDVELMHLHLQRLAARSLTARSER